MISEKERTYHRQSHRLYRTVKRRVQKQAYAGVPVTSPGEVAQFAAVIDAAYRLEVQRLGLAPVETEET